MSQFYSGKNSQIDKNSCSKEIADNSDTDSNIQEWIEYFDLTANYATFTKKLIYDNNLKQIRAALAELKSPANQYKDAAIHKAGKLAENPVFLKAVREYKKDALVYLIFAKECEEFANVYYDPWESSPPIQTAAMKAMEKRGISERNSVSDSSLKMRYAFQIIRLSHYRKAFKKTIEYFKQMKIENKSALYYRILSLYAGALTHTGESEKARYLFALVASRSRDYGPMAKVDFKNIHQDEKSFQRTLSFAKNNKERIEIYKIRSVIDNSVTTDDLQAVRDLNPDSGELGTILLYQIARLEKNLLNRFYAQKDIYPQEQFSSNKNRPDNKQVNQHRYSSWSEEEVRSLHEIRSFISETLEKHKTCNAFLWNLAGAYLSLLDEDYKKADRYFKKASSLQNSDSSTYLVHKQKELRLMYELMSGLPMDSLHKEKYATTLSSLYGKQKVEHTWKSYQPQMYLHRILKRALKDHRQENLALLISDWSGFNLEDFNTDELTKMLAMIEKREKDSLENYIVYQSGLKPAIVASRLASNLIKDNRLAEAIELTSRIPIAPLNRVYTHPFESPLADSLYPETKPEKWDKRSFAIYMLSLEKKLAAEKIPRKKAYIYFEIANGWYNISRFGRWWIITDDSWSIYFDKGKHKDLLLRAKTAWLKSSELSGQNGELGAQSLFLAALAEQRLNNLSPEGNREISEHERKIWEQMQYKYSNTSFFQSTVKECFYYRQVADVY